MEALFSQNTESQLLAKHGDDLIEIEGQETKTFQLQEG